MKLNGVAKELKYTYENGAYGQYSEKVAQRIKLEVEVYHHAYKTQAFTIQMGEKPFEKDINLEKWPLLKKIIAKSSNDSYNSDDWCSVKVTTPVSSCITSLDSGSNDFQSGDINTFTNLNTDGYLGNYWNSGNCQDFNITSLKKLEIMRTRKDIHNWWLGDYIKLESDNPCVNYKCTNYDWIAADDIWHKFDCKLYQRNQQGC